MSSESRRELSDAELGRIAMELREIALGSSWSRTLATGELVLKYFFAGSVSEWRTHRSQKDASIRRLARRPECPLGKSALSEAVAIYVARNGLPSCVEELTPSHVAIALRLPPPHRIAFLERAVAGTWSVREMRSESLKLKRRAGERRGRPRFSRVRAALSQVRTSLGALEAGTKLLEAAGEADSEAVRLLERTVAELEEKLGRLRERLADLAAPRLRSAPTASLLVPALDGRLAG